MVQKPNKITPEERRKLANLLQDSRERLLRVTRSLTPSQVDHKPCPERWSVGDNLEHVTVVEDLVFVRIGKSLQESPDSSKQSTWWGRDEDLIQAVESRVPRLEAPEIIQPTRRWQYLELFQQLDEVRQRTCKFVEETNAELRRHCFAHPVLGELDCYQWLLAMGAHFDRHRAQIEEIKADANFPIAVA